MFICSKGKSIQAYCLGAQCNNVGESCGVNIDANEEVLYPTLFTLFIFNVYLFDVMKLQ